jgi:hypothetical protein
MVSDGYYDTLRLLLQNKFDRIENLVKINHQSTVAVPAVLATIWGVEGDLNNFQNVWILCIISIALLLIWRYFAHFVDNGIAKNYVDIVKIEEILGVPSHISLYENIIDSLTDVKSCAKSTQQFRELNQLLKGMCTCHKKRFFECLYEKQKMGYRGHDKWDFIAFCIVFLCISMMILGQHFLNNWLGFFILSSFVVSLMVALGNIWLMVGLSLLLSLFLPFLFPVFLSIGIGIIFFALSDRIIQKDPSYQDILVILKEMKCPIDPCQ